MIRLADNLLVTEDDIVYRFSRSTGPGGQNVNKLNTRVTLLFNIPACRTLTTEQKQRLLTSLSSRISRDGCLKVVSQRHRTQQANRRAALNRLAELLTAALVESPVRKPTAISYGAHQRRLRRKRRRSEIKEQRKAVAPD
jgi:ribosome-associated protein